MVKKILTFREISGINIQWPWSQLIAEGKKTIETRGYALVDKYIGQELAIIETPGPQGRKIAGIGRAQIIGTVVFEECFQYRSREEWEEDSNLHQVPVDDPRFGFGKRTQTWGWRIMRIKRFNKPLPVPEKRGIIFASNCKIPTE